MTLAMLTGALLIISGFALGFGLGGAFQRRHDAGSSTAPRCTCKHGFSEHKKGRECQVSLVENYHRFKCPCTVYVGPDPVLSGLWTPSV